MQNFVVKKNKFSELLLLPAHKVAILFRRQLLVLKFITLAKKSLTLGPNRSVHLNNFSNLYFVP